MNTENVIDRFVPASRRAFVLGFGLAFCVLVLTVLTGTLYFRSVVRNQIASRDAEGLHATTILEQMNLQAEVGSDLGDDEVGLEAALLASRLKGVMGIRFFDLAGKFKDSFPANILPRDLDAWAGKPLESMRPSSRFTPQMPLDQVFIYLPQFSTGRVSRAPILEIVVPLHRRDGQTRSGAAQFIVEGQSMATEYARLDRNLGLLAGIAVLAAGLLLFAMLWPIFRKLERLNHELAQRSERLLRANQELALAARTSALGAVSAHLMHGLKNPLASLSQYVRARADAPEGKSQEDDSRDAISATRRMQALVEETLEVLSDARGEPGYQVSGRELLEALERTLSPRASRRNVHLSVSTTCEIPLSSRRANLVRLVLTNLADNGIDATPSGKTVSVSAEQKGTHVRFTIRDEGPGFPDHLRSSLFLPCKSTREGGGGVGLAISHQIAEYLAAKLELSESSHSGCIFVLELPIEENPPETPAGSAARSTTLPGGSAQRSGL